MKKQKKNKVKIISGKKQQELSEMEKKIIKELLKNGEGYSTHYDGTKWWTVWIGNCNLKRLGLTNRQFSGYLSSLQKKGVYKFCENWEGKRDGAYGEVKDVGIDFKVIHRTYTAKNGKLTLAKKKTFMFSDYYKKGE